LKPSTSAAIEASTGGCCQILDPNGTWTRPKVLTAARELDTEQLTSLKGLLLDPDSWYFCVKRCLPRDTALFQTSGSRGTVSVLVGFTCSGWIVTGPRERRGGFFDPVHDKLLGLLKSIFAEHASPNRRSIWRSGTIAELRSKLRPEGNN